MPVKISAVAKPPRKPHLTLKEKERLLRIKAMVAFRKAEAAVRTTKPDVPHPQTEAEARRALALKSRAYLSMRGESSRATNSVLSNMGRSGSPFTLRQWGQE